jgi:SAM-dependent methyltransferase
VDLSGFTDWLKHLGGRQAYFPHQMSFVLELPLRRLLVTPAQLADRLHLERSSRVLEVGAGSGVFSVEVARRVPDGHLELFDLQPEMLEKCRSKVESASVAGVVGYTQGDAEALPFPPSSFDVAFLVAVLGEIPEPRRCLTGLRRILRPGGLLSITEHLPDPDFSRLSRIRSLVEGEGFAFDERFGPPWAFTANFRRPPSVGDREDRLHALGKN